MKPKRFTDAVVKAASSKRIILVAVSCILAAIAVTCCLRGCLPTSDSSNDASTQPAAQSGTATESVSSNGISASDDISTPSGTNDTEAVTANFPSASDSSSQSSAGAVRRQSGSGSNQAETVSSESGQTSSGSNASDNVTAAAPEKVWVIDYAQIWVEYAGAWDEQTPVYGYVEKSVCNICRAEITGNEVAHGKAHMLAGEGSGHHTEVSQVITGYATTHHDAVGCYETVESGGHWE